MALACGGVRTDATGLVEGDGSGGRQVRTEGGRRVVRGERRMTAARRQCEDVCHRIGGGRREWRKMC
jgi:hypothetical protein